MEQSLPSMDTLSVIRVRGDRVMSGVLGVAFIEGLVLNAWFGQSWALALGFGLMILVVPLLIARRYPGTVISRVSLALAGLSFVLLHIQLSRGVVEAHFGIFVVLAALLMYCDWKPLIAAGGLGVAHHLGAVALQGAGYPVYVFPVANWLEIVPHGFYVLSEIAVLLYAGGVIAQAARDSNLIQEAAARIARGDLNTPIPPQECARSDALRAFAHMQDGLCTLLRQLREGASEVAVSAGQLSALSLRIQGAAREQAAASDEISTSIEEMSASIDSLAGHSHSAQELSALSTRTAAAAGATVQSAVQEVEIIAAGGAELADLIRRLGEQGATIERMASVIHDVTDQTNLLALNAAIEAARAGDHGRGFSVVADEVRNLAQRTASSTAEIRTLISGIQGATTQAVSNVAQWELRMGSTVGRAREAGQQMETLEAGGRELGALVSEMAAALAEQATVTQGAARSIEQISASSQHNRQEVEQLNALAASLETLAHTLNTSASRFAV